jgi:hypothetical protein
MAAAVTARLRGLQPGSQAKPPDPEEWRVDNETIIDQVIGEIGQTTLRYHLFLSHRQVGGGAQVGELDEIWKSIGLKCWRDVAQPHPDETAMIRGVAESSVFTLYLTKDALSKYVLLEAWAAMKLRKPVIVLADDDSRKPSYAGGSVEEATNGWPQDLIEYFWTGKFVTWGGQPMAWNIWDQNAKLKTMLDCCVLWESQGRAQIPEAPDPSMPGCSSWTDALGALSTRGADRPPSAVPEEDQDLLDRTLNRSASLLSSPELTSSRTASAELGGSE